MKKLIIMALLSSISLQAFAYETKEGKITNLELNTPSASGRNVIVWLEGVAQMCNISSGNDSGYFNKADSPDTFSAFLSVLLAAKAAGNTVRVLTIPGTEGCRIDRVELLND